LSIQLNGISKNFVTHTLFSELSLEIGAKSRIGLIGRNGCGKSTLLKIILGHLQPDGGSIYRAPKVHINYLSQEPRINPELTLQDELRSVFGELNELREEETRLIEQLGDPSFSEDEHMQMAERLCTLHELMERFDPQSVDARVDRILKGLGFTEADHQRKSGEFSGGWQMRINLAKVLLEGADILLMDEPTNHLDLEACEWLENFLREYPGGLIVVSHDRRFLDQVTTEIAELEFGKIQVWTGNYTSHLEQKAIEIEQQTAAYERQQKELAKQTAFVDRFRASATRGTQAKSREKQLAKVERLEAPQEDHRRMALRFPSPQPSGVQVLTLSDVRKAFGNKLLFSGLNAEMERQQRIFLLGENGTGKTTLLRLILGEEKLDDGEIRRGHNVLMGYFSQNQLDTLDAELSIFDTLQLACPKLTNTEIRSLLGRFLFNGEQVFKPISVLSGGEKSKVALAKLMMSGSNTLLLDEPTNHMDMPAKDVITEALKEYEGSFLCISHDRYFIEQLATHIWEIYKGQLLIYCGGYDYYLFKRAEMHAKADQFVLQNQQKAAQKLAREAAIQTSGLGAVALDKSVSPLQARKEIEKQLTKAEKGILNLETEIAKLTARMEDPAIQQDYQKLHALSAEVEDKRASLTQLNATWAELAEQLA
jgi:ATP-binding cassette subfamily F protein 3